MKTTRHFLTNPLLAVAVLAVAGITSRASATPADDVAAVKKLEQESVKADLAGDLSFVKSHFADDASLGTSFGEWESKEGMLKDMADKQNNKVNNEEITDLKVRVYGNTAIATYRSTYDMVVRGEPRARTIIATDTWVKQKGGWKLVAAHASEAKK
ncbi:MAG TPA: nuclear transport factor 2 family protein [Anaeromyxobacter sp.]|nr:nuclear transport factor 2 family protein [Anaeromyxobacter sp.]